jgi:DNA helicase II / ATP-dependent DNA helicase PcrA
VKTSELISGLNKEQQEVVLCVDGPSLVIAGPGSGKTRALTHKIAYLIKEIGLYPDEILAVTFTNKAAAEMKERVTSILKDDDLDLNSEAGFSLKDLKTTPSWIGTFHSISSRILRIEASSDPDFLSVDKNFVIYDTDDSNKLIKDILNELNLNTKDFSPTAISSTISRLKGELVTPAEFLAQASSSSYYFQKVAKIYPMYQQKLKENNALDFGDLLFETVRLLSKRSEVLQKYQSKFKYILIDEYQDTNKVQYFFVKLLSAKHRNLTVVGDISQSIYSWRGANYKNMMQFEKDYPEAKIFKLAKNYRSTKNIITAAKKLIENNRTHIPIDLYTDNDNGSLIKLYEAEHERSEAQYVTEMINFLSGELKSYEYLPQKKYGNFAILYRTNAQSRVIEEALITYGLPYKIIGGVRFYDRKEVKDVMSYLRVFCNPKDSVSWGRCINTPPRGIGKVTFQKLADSKFDLELVDKTTKANWSKYINLQKEGKTNTLELLDAVLKDFGYLEYLNDGTEESLSRIENLQELRTVAGQYKDLPEFLETVALVESSNRTDMTNQDAVILMTLHSAKGLEFDTVFLVGMEEGLFPHSRAMTDPDELEEERRLCYVGITRAKKQLFLTYTRRRTFFGSTGSSIVSRFISEIPEDLIEFKFS